ncbi:MAG: 16S rRNA (guanine(966)-N(2))-methyltransferase RsmD [Clostridia bacterium]|nr:16S rRNA (guanine(966)-N(2))-methyltransferase RsmD [Clostridia bacterium]
MMRIITGKAKGIRLKTLEGDATRPTSERAKEAVFSILMDDIQGREILDLFSGSGQMALEALSRGAAHAVMVDRSPAAVKIITENAQKTKLISNCEIRCEDYLSFIKKSKNRKFDLIFIDPPYTSGAYMPALDALLSNDNLKATSLIVCESSDESFAEEITKTNAFSVIKQSKYGKAVITIITLREAQNEE